MRDTPISAALLPSIRTSLVLSGFGDQPADVTRILGISPSRAARTGEPLLTHNGTDTGRRARLTYWSLHSQTDPRAPLEDQISNILHQLRGKENLFKGLPSGTIATLKCTVFPEDEVPLLRVGSTVLQALAGIHASLEIDVISVDEAPASEQE